jgi:hypothetical protein
MDAKIEAPPGGYRWPWFLAAAVAVATVIAVFAIRSEANRVKTERLYQIPATEPSAPTPGTP